MDAYEVEASRYAKSSRGEKIPTDLDWLDQPGLNVVDASKDGTSVDVPTPPALGLILF